ncbi:MAG TPA: hypothetical protein VNO75_12475, partial [Gemmatimonadaceae bacterium]|nr:hypothetical protein [Gemmatimonadaceae bacterium]
MGEVERRGGPPRHVGDVAIDALGNVTPSGEPKDLRADVYQAPSVPGGTPRLQLVENAATGGRAEPTIRIPAPYIAAKFVDAGFETYRPDPAAPSQRSALATAREFCRRVQAGEGALLALIGSTGTGKSHLLYSAAKSLHEAGRRVFTRPWYLLADHLRYGGPGLFSSNPLEPQEL